MSFLDNLFIFSNITYRLVFFKDGRKAPWRLEHHLFEKYKDKIRLCEEFNPEIADDQKSYIYGFMDGLIGFNKNPYMVSGHERDTTFQDERHMSWKSGNDDAQSFLLNRNINWGGFSPQI